MQQQSFRELGVSAPVVEALASRGIHEPFPHPVPRPSRRPRRPRTSSARSPTGSGKTLAFALAIVERLSHRDAGVRALVLVPTRELAAQVAEELGCRRPARSSFASRPCTAACRSARRRSARRPRTSSIATPGRLEDLISRRLVSLDRVEHPRARRSRPDARHGLPAAGRQDRRARAPRAPDDVLLGDARRRGRAVGRIVHAERVAVRGRAAAERAERRDRPRSSCR